MNIGHLSIDRPRFATVLSLLIIIVGAIGYFELPVTQYPEIAPPTVVVSANYPGATAEVVADTVATPIEQEMNGVDGMLYMTSDSTNDGSMSLSVTFAPGTDLDDAQVQVQNRVAVAEARLPEPVRRLGVVTRKSSPDLMMAIHLESPDNSLDQLYISNYALLQVRDVLARVDGVGDLRVFGAREYAIRIWLDPDRLASLDLTATDVIAALRDQNVQVSGGALGLPPADGGQAFQVTVTTQGRFDAPDQFRDVIVKAADDGRLVRLSDVARVELGARSYATNSYLNGKPATVMAVFQRPGSNALETAEQLKLTMETLSLDFPPGLGYRIVYNPTEFIAESVNAVYTTIFEAVVLVILVIILFLQSWRAALIPIVAIPVSLIGTFAVMSAFGFSLNNLTLFGLVLAIGIVVDDAIVVVENIERNLARGLSPREASRVTMSEVGTALVSIALVLTAVFIPTAFLGGISGQFFRQFAMTVAVATIISAFNSLTLSPALGSVLLHAHDAPPTRFGRAWKRALGPVFGLWERGFDGFQRGYGKGLRRVLRRPGLALLAFLALLVATAVMLQQVPRGFIPHQDQGYVIVAVELPKGASLARTDGVVRRAVDIIDATPGTAHTMAIVGFSGATFSSASNAAAIFVPMDPFSERGRDLNSTSIVESLNRQLAVIKDAQIFVIDPPPVRGLGRGGGFKAMIQDRSGQGLAALESATWQLAGAANQHPMLDRVFTTFSLATPQVYLDIDRTRAEMLEVPVGRVFAALEQYLGSAYVNDINLYGRTYQVVAQADQDFRMTTDDIERLRVRSDNGAMVPLGSLIHFRSETGPDRLVRHNLYPTIELQGSYPAGVSSGDGIAAFEQLARDTLPDGIAMEWTEIAYQERNAGNAGLLLFPLSVLLVFLLLTAQYESWTLPLVIVLIVPLAILFALLGVAIGGMDNNILTQIAFVVLIGLASKNAILIVEFARQHEESGADALSAALQAADLRLRPIVMTSLAFILGVVPLVLATGAGAEMRQVLGTAVFSGMLGITAVGLFLTPAFYVLIRRRLAAPSGATSKVATPSTES